MMALMSVCAQLSGNSVLTYYLPSMYTRVGIVSTERRLLLTFMNSIVSCAGAVAGAATNDAVGRRTKLWVGSVVLAGLFAGVTGFSSHFEDGRPGPAVSNGGVAFIFLFGCAYSFVYTPLTPTYCAEVLSNPTRAKGMGVVSRAGFVSCTGSFIARGITPGAANFSRTACHHWKFGQSVQHVRHGGRPGSHRLEILFDICRPECCIWSVMVSLRRRNPWPHPGRTRCCVRNKVASQGSAGKDSGCEGRGRTPGSNAGSTR